MLEGIGGRDFNDNQEAAVVNYRLAAFSELVGGVATYSLDEGNADRLWNFTTPLLGCARYFRLTPRLTTRSVQGQRKEYRR